MPLLELLSSSPDAVKQMKIVQIVAVAGDGKLRDNSDSQTELREFLRNADVAHLSSYATHCLNDPFDKSGQVLQDIVNELGRRLEYAVLNGRYQGSTKEIGWDGVWRDPNGSTLVIEVKSTDAYTIRLDTIAHYRNQLLQQKEIAEPSSILIVVGRSDTGALEAQVRGSRHAWDIRLISVESLVNLVRVKESTESFDTVTKIRRLLTPLEYTRLDSLVEIVFVATQDVETSVSTESGHVANKDETSLIAESADSGFTPSAIIQDVRERIVSSYGRIQGVNFIKKSRALYWDPAQQHRAVCTVSKRYTSQGNMKYWYAYHPQWRDFLHAGISGTFILGCIDLDVAFGIPEAVLNEHLSELHVTQKTEDDLYYHIKIIQNELGEYVLQLPRSGKSMSLSEFQLPITQG